MSPRGAKTQSRTSKAFDSRRTVADTEGDAPAIVDEDDGIPSENDAVTHASSTPVATDFAETVDDQHVNVQ